MPVSFRLFLALAACAALALGCHERPVGSPPPAPSSPDSTEMPVPDSAATLPPAPPPSDSSGTPGVESVYTDLDLARCTVLSRSEEDVSVDYRCPGYGGLDVFVSDGDARMDVDIGVPNGVWTTPGNGAFNGVGETVEWRLHRGRPVAAIVRYRIEGGPGGTPPPRSELAVLAVGRPGAPGCLVAWVSTTAAPDQNTAARRIADTQAAAFACPDAQP